MHSRVILWLLHTVLFEIKDRVKLDYRQTSDIGRTDSQNLNAPCLFLQLPLPNPLKPGLKSRMKI